MKTWLRLPESVRRFLAGIAFLLLILLMTTTFLSGLIMSPPLRRGRWQVSLTPKNGGRLLLLFFLVAGCFTYGVERGIMFALIAALLVLTSQMVGSVPILGLFFYWFFVRGWLTIGFQQAGIEQSWLTALLIGTSALIAVGSNGSFLLSRFAGNAAEAFQEEAEEFCEDMLGNVLLRWDKDYLNNVTKEAREQYGHRADLCESMQLSAQTVNALNMYMLRFGDVRVRDQKLCMRLIGCDTRSEPGESLIKGFFTYEVDFQEGREYVNAVVVKDTSMKLLGLYFPSMMVTHYSTPASKQ